jgi:hypothetical protein
MKPLPATLRSLSIRTIVYLDDMLIMASTRDGAERHLASALELLVALGFMVNMRKSVVQPTQVMEFLGYVLDSRRMVISLPQQR